MKKVRLASIETLCKLAKQGVDGRSWYYDAAEHVSKAAELLGVNASKLADYLALFSPRVSVKRSIKFTLAYLQRGEYADDVMKGIRASVEHYNATGKIRGPKTAPFAKALQGDAEAIVLDVWMAKAFGVDQAAFNRKPIHAECCRRIRVAAKRLGWKPAEVQAAVWCAIVRKHGRKPAKLQIVRATLFGTELAVTAA